MSALGTGPKVWADGGPGPGLPPGAFICSDGLWSTQGGRGLVLQLELSGLAHVRRPAPLRPFPPPPLPASPSRGWQGHIRPQTLGVLATKGQKVSRNRRPIVEASLAPTLACLASRPCSSRAEADLVAWALHSPGRESLRGAGGPQGTTLLGRWEVLPGLACALFSGLWPFDHS